MHKGARKLFKREVIICPVTTVNGQREIIVLYHGYVPLRFYTHSDSKRKQVGAGSWALGVGRWEPGARNPAGKRKPELDSVGK